MPPRYDSEHIKAYPFSQEVLIQWLQWRFKDWAASYPDEYTRVELKDNDRYVLYTPEKLTPDDMKAIKKLKGKTEWTAPAHPQGASDTDGKTQES